MTMRSSVTEDIMNVWVSYYLEDAAIKIVEAPAVGRDSATAGETSKLMGQVGHKLVVKREILNKPGTNIPFKPLDLDIGMVLATHGHKIRFVDCDEVTRRYYKEEHDKTLRDALPYPKNPTQALEATLHQKTLHIAVKHEQAGKKFLDFYDNKFLRFRCQWDDDRLYGERKLYELKYMLQYEKIELTEIGNQGEKLLAARRVPKKGGAGKAYLTHKDLICGQHVHVYGRQMLMLECCDNFTREFYMAHIDPPITQQSAEPYTPQSSAASSFVSERSALSNSSSELSRRSEHSDRSTRNRHSEHSGRAVRQAWGDGSGTGSEIRRENGREASTGSLGAVGSRRGDPEAALWTSEAIALFRSYFAKDAKFAILRECRQADNNQTGKIGVGAFVEALLATCPCISDEHKRTFSLFFSRAGEVVDYRMTLRQVL
jgi:hypothetical protein